MKSSIITALSTLLFTGVNMLAFGQQADPADVATPEDIVRAAYESIIRKPGEDFDWDRFRSLYIPNAVLIPQTEQRGGEFSPMNPQGFVDWISGVTTIGGPDDQGFSEEGIHNVVNRYGDVASVVSTYRKFFYGANEVLGRGVNIFQLVHHDNRWWIVSIIWDEENAAGPIPERYLPK